MDDLREDDLYELLGILSSASAQEIKKAYRKKALKCHPDKNPDNPKAAELFHQLSRALEILADDSARAAYDKVINAKKAAALRNRELDSKRKKLKEDLEARERKAQNEEFQQKSAENKLKAEIERLRKEGSKQLEEEIEYVRLQVQREKLSSSEPVDPSLFRLKISWKISNSDEISYSYDNLEKIFSKYGDIAALVVSSKKKGSALLEFASTKAAVKAQKLEQGYLTNPLTVSWLSGAAPPSSVWHQSYSGSEGLKGPGLSTPPSGASIFPSVPSAQAPHRAFPCFPSAPDIFTKNRQEKQDSDFESAVLERMRQAEEDKKSTAEKEAENKNS